MRITLAVAIAVLALAGCLEGEGPNAGGPETTPTPATSTPAGSTPAATPTPPPGTPTPTAPSGPHAVDFRRLDAGQQSGIQEKKVGYVTSEAEWTQFWAMHSSEPRPSVEFARETVAYVFAGERGNSCWAERITEVLDDGAGFTTARHTLYSPPPEAFCADVITYPYDIVAIDGAGRTVGFSEERATYPPAGSG